MVYLTVVNVVKAEYIIQSILYSNYLKYDVRNFVFWVIWVTDLCTCTRHDHHVVFIDVDVIMSPPDVASKIELIDWLIAGYIKHEQAL